MSGGLCAGDDLDQPRCILPSFKLCKSLGHAPVLPFRAILPLLHVYPL